MSEINPIEKNAEMLGVKIKASTKTIINDLIEKAKQAGMIEYNGDIFDLFVKNFQQDELAKKMEYGADLKELQQITRRINDIFVNLAERNESNIADINTKHGFELHNLNEDILELKESKKKLQEKLTEKDDYINELTSTIKVNQERNKELEEVHIGYIERLEEQKSLIDEKTNQIDNKNEIISDKVVEIESMREDIAKNKELKSHINVLDKEILSLHGMIEDKNAELVRQKESMEFECQKRIFAREQELNKEKAEEIRVIQEQMNKQQDKYEKLLDEKDKLRSAYYELKTTIDQEQSKNEKYENTIGELQRENNDYELTINDLQSRIKELENKLNG